MFEQTLEAHGHQEKSETATPFVPARIYLSRDGRYLLHALPDGKVIGRHVNYYRSILGKAHDPRWRSLCASPCARLVVTVATWLVRLLVVAWMALHPGVHLPTTPPSSAHIAPAD